MPAPDETPTFPGYRLVDNWLRAQSHVWRRHLDTLNEVWGDMTTNGASVDTVASSCSKLMQVWSDNARHLFDSAIAPMSLQSLTRCPVVAFTLDHAAEASDRRSLPLPTGIDPSSIKIAPLSDGPAPSRLAPFLDVAVNPSGHSLEIALMNLAAFTDKTGMHQALIYADVMPPPKPALALVVVTFTPP